MLVLFLLDALAGLFALPRELVRVMGIANLAYAAVSFTLAMSARRGRVPFLRVVAAANATASAKQTTPHARFAAEASGFGLAQLIGEGLFVGGLGALEWRAAQLQGAA